MRRTSIVLSLVVLQFLAASPAPAQDTGEVARLRREIELLRKENELLRKKLTLNPGVERKDGPAKVTLHNVEYEFVHIKLDGAEATMRIAVTSKKGQRMIHGPTAEWSPAWTDRQQCGSDGRTGGAEPRHSPLNRNWRIGMVGANCRSGGVMSRNGSRPGC
jgi:hypothetical protein